MTPRGLSMRRTERSARACVFFLSFDAIAIMNKTVEHVVIPCKCILC